MSIVMLVFGFVYSLPCWLPLVFVGYAVGRKQFGTRLLFVLLTAEALALAAILGITALINSNALKALGPPAGS